MRAIAPFAARYRHALTDDRLRRNLLAFQRAWRDARAAALDHLAAQAALGVPEASFAGQRRRLAEAKRRAARDRPELAARFTAAATAAGAVIFEAATAEAANRYVLDLCRRRGATLVAKGKSMVSEELFLNAALEAAGLSVVETDLGEWIVQLAQEMPSHMVMPAIHKSRQQVGALLEAHLGRPVSREDVSEMARVARQALRGVFEEAGVGITGANALIAETGTVMLVTNEGNGRLTSSLPPVHVVLASWDKLVATWDDAAAQARLLARSGTAQDITVYTTFITGPDDPARELHVVVVDNGRSAMAADPEFEAALRCIRCAACANVCPPYQVVGGHVFGHVYTGPIGLVTTPFHHGLAAAAGPQSLCVSCHACAAACPAEIPLPDLILDVRRRVAERLGTRLRTRLGLRLWASPRLLGAAMTVARVALAPLRRGGSLRLPLPRAWRWRALPVPAAVPARARLLGREFPGDLRGPLAGSAARGLRVAYLLQCLSDRFAPEQATAAVRVLRACGAAVVVPGAQHCCGLPALDAGDLVTARRMAQRTIAALESAAVDRVVTAAASCAIALRHDYPRLLRDDPAWHGRAAALAARTVDLVGFLDREARPAAGALAGPRSGSGPPVTYYGFCQSTNRLGVGGTGARLLRDVCGLDLRDLPEGEVCCGFGGLTSFEHPAVAREIAWRKLDNVTATGATVLVTDNPGCLLHLRGAAEAAGLPLRVAHLAEVVAERLGPE